MVVFPNAKINLGLNIICKRPDGYHELETSFYPIGIRDALEILPIDDPHGDASGVTLTTSGIPVDGPAENNICTKAWHLIRKDFPQIPPIHVHLHKAIPTGAGLGGGSADGAFTLRLLNSMFGLGIDDHSLATYALALGSDCPFFLLNLPCFASGRGETMTPSGLNLSDFSLLVIHPGIHVSTAEAFRGVKPAIPVIHIPNILAMPVDQWRDTLVNDFEHTVFPLFPEIASIKDLLYDAGAIYSSMSGSGSSVFGIFPKNGIPDMSFPEHYMIHRQESMKPDY
jgi:4-diphosphocytidyl-2-C-methyl-D-erythritol kinase